LARLTKREQEVLDYISEKSGSAEVVTIYTKMYPHTTLLVVRRTLKAMKFIFRGLD
jgi:Fe2+ or Zn2+ uptake regulation protein